MSCPKLTGTMICELAQCPGLEGLPETLLQARLGDRRSISKLKEFSIKISKNDFYSQWSGDTPVQSVSESFTAELAALESNSSTGIQNRIPGPQVSSSPKNRPHSTDIFSAPYSFPKWRQLAREAGFPIHKFRKSEQELLNFIDRVLIQGRGFGPDDRMRGQRNSVAIIPSKLSKHGNKFHSRTYQRATKLLLEIGLIGIISTDLSGNRCCRPLWWSPGSEVPDLKVWTQAKQVYESPTENLSHKSRTDVALPSRQRRTSVAPPVLPESSLTTHWCKRLDPVGVRHFSRRLTSNFDIITLGLGITSPLYHSDRSSPCLPDRQARRENNPKMASEGAIE